MKRDKRIAREMKNEKNVSQIENIEMEFIHRFFQRSGQSLETLKEQLRQVERKQAD